MKIGLRIIGVVLMGTLFAVFATHLIQKARAIGAAKKWPIVNGTLRSFEVVAVPDGHSAAPAPKITYAFQFQDGDTVKEYLGSNLYLGVEVGGTRGDINQLKKVWDGNRVVSIRVNPVNPNESFLAMTDISLDEVMTWGMGLFCVLASFGMFWNLVAWRSNWISQDDWGTED